MAAKSINIDLNVNYSDLFEVVSVLSPFIYFAPNISSSAIYVPDIGYRYEHYKLGLVESYSYSDFQHVEQVCNVSITDTFMMMCRCDVVEILCVNLYFIKKKKKKIVYSRGSKQVHPFVKKCFDLSKVSGQNEKLITFMYNELNGKRRVATSP